MEMQSSAGPFSYADIRRNTVSYNLPDRLITSISEPISWVLVNHTAVSPNTLSLLGGAFGMLGALFFFREQWNAAGLAYLMFFVLDCCDGAVARVTNRTSAFGAFLDLFVDRAVLLVAVLTRAAYHSEHNQPVAAWLCAVYLASHYAVDLRWLMDLREQVDRPRQFRALAAVLRRQAPAAPRDGVPRVLRRIARNLLPSTWFCNIAFVLGGCFLLGARPLLYLGAALALQWPPLVNAVLRLIATRRGAA